MKSATCILFYAKFPERGRVKTRLAKHIGDKHALELYKCFILDMLETFDSIALRGGDTHICICYAPESAEQAFREWLGTDYVYWPQQGNDLGERMSQSFRQAFQMGYEQAVIIGSDLPDVSGATIVSAFEELRSRDTVIGPTDDGGYYLLGFRHDTFAPEVFENIAWSTSSVYPETLTKIDRAGLTVSMLPKWSDVDNYEDLQKFYKRNRQRQVTKTIAYVEQIQVLA